MIVLYVASFFVLEKGEKLTMAETKTQRVKIVQSALLIPAISVTSVILVHLKSRQCEYVPGQTKIYFEKRYLLFYFG